MTIWNAYIHRVILVSPNSKRLCCAWPAFAPLRCQYMFILRMQHFSPKACNAHLIHSSKQRSVIQWNIKINIHAPNQQKPSQKRQRFQNHATHATCIALNCDMLYHIHSDAILAVSTLNPPPRVVPILYFPVHPWTYSTNSPHLCQAASSCCPT